MLRMSPQLEARAFQSAVGLRSVWLRWSKPFWDIPSWLVGEFTTRFGTYVGGDWEVHWGYRNLTHGHLTQKVTRLLDCVFGLTYCFTFWD